MTEKRLTRERKWGLHTYPYFQLRMDNDFFKGWIAVNHLTDGETFYMDFPKSGKKPVVGEGMKWLTLIPDNQKRAITAFISKEGKITCWYIDVIESWKFCEDGVISFLDKYLDVLMTPEGEYFVDDEDELEAAYKSGELSKNQYEDALKEGQLIVKELAHDILKTKKWCLQILNEAEKEICKNQFAIFLDIDGVLDIFNPEKEIQTLIPEAVDLLCNLVKHTEAKIILASDWKNKEKLLNHLKNTFKEKNLEIFAVTPSSSELKNRTSEIKEYLKQHPQFKRYVILDDCFSDDYSSDLEIKSHLVFVDALKGLQFSNLMEVSVIMNRIKAVNYPF